MLPLLITLGLLAVIVFLLFIFIVFISIPTPGTFFDIMKIPGPPGHWIFGNSLETAHLTTDEYLLWLTEKMAIYPRMMKLWILGKPFVYLIDPDDVQVILSSNVHIKKGFDYAITQPWLCDGLIHSSGQKWHMRRKMLTPPFHFQILEGATPVLNKHCQWLVNRISSFKGEQVDVLAVTSECTLNAICESAMGIDLSEDEETGKKYTEAVKRISDLGLQRLIHPWLLHDWLFFRMPIGKKYVKERSYLHNFTNSVVKERKEEFFKTRDEFQGKKSGKIRLAFLDTLLEIEARKPGTLSSSDIREEVDAFMFAGHDTTSTFLNIFFSMIGTYKEAQNLIYEELKKIFADDMNRNGTYADLANMNYMDCTIKEVMRLYAPVPYISRDLHKDLILSDGTKIPAGTNLIISPYLIHKNPKYWDEPEKFNPERFFYDEGRHPFSFIPFSAGPRNCIGQRYAMNEIKMAIAYVIRKFKVEALTKHGDFQPGMKIIFYPTKKIFCTFHEREAAK